MKKLTKLLLMMSAISFFAGTAMAANPGVAEIRHLTELLRDGQQGYALSATEPSSEKLGQLFNQYSEQRAKFLSDLQAEVARLGGDPDAGGSAKGAVHRGVIKTRAAGGDNDDRAIVDEVLRGEDAALKGYQQALSKDLPEDTRKLV